MTYTADIIRVLSAVTLQAAAFTVGIIALIDWTREAAREQ